MTLRGKPSSSPLPYTDEVEPQSMSLVRNRRVTRKTILRVLIAGFSLVILLLAAASVVSFRNTRALQADAGRLVQQQLLSVRLLHELQAEQGTLNAVFYQLVHSPESMDEPAVVKELEETEQALSHIEESAKGTPEEQLWHDLVRSAREFSSEARLDIQADTDPTPASIRSLLAKHDQVIQLANQLMEASSADAMRVEKLVEGESRDLLNDSFILLGTTLVFAFVCAVLTVRMVTDLFRRMEIQASELNRVSWHMLQGQEAAARRFSHELHDELGQGLSALKANLSALNEKDLGSRRADCIHLVDEAISNVRELSQLLRPVILDDFGLDASLRWLAEKFTQRTNIQVDYRSNFSGRLADESETHLFRIGQEALTNVARHSGATRVDMSLIQSVGKIRLRIADNGHGMVKDSPANSGLGMVGMSARAKNSGGEFQLESSSSGLAVEVVVPVTNVPNDTEQENSHFVSR